MGVRRIVSRELMTATSAMVRGWVHIVSFPLRPARVHGVGEAAVVRGRDPLTFAFGCKDSADLHVIRLPSLALQTQVLLCQCGLAILHRRICGQNVPLACLW